MYMYIHYHTALSLIHTAQEAEAQAASIKDHHRRRRRRRVGSRHPFVTGRRAPTAAARWSQRGAVFAVAARYPCCLMTSSGICWLISWGIKKGNKKGDYTRGIGD